MMRGGTLEEVIRFVVNNALDQAEVHWKEGGHQLVKKSMALDSIQESMEAEPSKIPGHPIVRDDVTVVDEFIAYVADMRDSSKHLLCAISEKVAKVSGLQRVYYETSALLPALSVAVRESKGRVTEYLGDGLLALFRVEKGREEDAVYAAHAAAKNSIGLARGVVNDVLRERYSLPSLSIGVGLAYSKALVTLVGLPGDKHPKAFGECVFRATKLSSGVDQIHIDQNLKVLWPKQKGGVLSFREKSIGDVRGYLIERSS